MDILNKDIFNKNSPNIIFYGHNININDYLYDKFGKLNSIIENKITYQNNSNCKVFDINNIKKKNIEYLFIFLKSILITENYYNKYNQHIIIFKDYNFIHNSIQNKLRVIIEKYRKTTQFLLITNSFGTIIYPIQSRCLCIRVPEMNYKSKRNLSREYIKDKPYEERIPIYDKIYSLHEKDEIILYSKYNEYIQKHEDIYIKIYKKLEYWINTDFNLREIKDYSYNILKYDVKNIHIKLCELFIQDPKYTSKQKFKCIKCLTDCEYEFKKSYRSLVHIEKMFIQLIYLLD